MEKQIQILLNRLSGYASYEDKMKWLNTGIVGNKSQMSVQTYIDKVPGLREQVNEHMVNTISVEQGNPESAGFTFSTEYSNAKLLEILNKFEAGETKIANLFGETQVENASDEILELQEKWKTSFLHDAGTFVITGSGDAFASPIFRKLLRTKKSA